MRRRSAVLGVMLLLSGAAEAQFGPLGSELQINAHTTDNQLNPSVLVDAAGFVATWFSDGQDGDGYGIFGRRFDTAGSAIGDDFQVNVFTTGIQRGPSVSAAADGDFVVFWGSQDQDGSLYGELGRRFDSAGQPLTLEFQVNTYTTSIQRGQRGGSTSANGSLVAFWQSFDQDGDSFGAFGQRFDSDGLPIGAEFRVNTYTTGSQIIPTAAMRSDGSFVVTWQSNLQDGSSYGAFGQRFDSTGAEVGTEFQINSFTTNDQARPVVSQDEGAGFLVTWHSDGQDGDSFGVFGQRFDSDGLPAGAEFQVNSYTTGSQRYPWLAVDSDGTFLVAWHSNGQDGSLNGIFGRRFDINGQAIGDEFQVNTYTTGSQSIPDVSAGASGSFLVTWSSNGQDGSGNGVFAQRFAVFPTATPTSTTTATSTETATVTPTSAQAECAATPLAGCTTPGKAIFKLKKNAADSSKNKLLWKWKGSIATGDLSDPTATTSYRLCVYGDSVLAMSPLIEAGGNWSPAGSGFKFKNDATNTDGVFKSVVKEGAGNAKLLVKGKGANLALPMPLTDLTAVTVQLTKDAGSGNQCWTSVFDAADAINTTEKFKDKL